MTENQWIEQCRPIPNPYDVGAGFDFGNGSCLFSQNTLKEYMSVHEVKPDCIWTVIESGETDALFLSQGQHWVNALGYIVTEDSPYFSLTQDIELD